MIMMFMYNMDVDARDMVLFGEKYNPDKYIGGYRLFESLTLHDLSLLMACGFIDPAESQNDSPTTKDIYDFMEQHFEFTACGYAISPDRSDYRITLDEIRCEDDVDMETLKDFVEFAKYADELDVRPYLRAWWD